MPSIFFTLGLSLLLTHEMDAVRAREWRLFIGLAALPEEAAFRLFTALHIPLYALLLWALAGGPPAGLIVALDAFMVIHAGLHWLFRRRPAYEFRSWFSWAIIVGAAACGALDLLVR